MKLQFCRTRSLCLLAFPVRRAEGLPRRLWREGREPGVPPPGCKSALPLARAPRPDLGRDHRDDADDLRLRRKPVRIEAVGRPGQIVSHALKGAGPSSASRVVSAVQNTLSGRYRVSSPVSRICSEREELLEQIKERVALAVDEGLAGLALRLQRIEFLLEPLLGGFAGVDRTANPCIPTSGAFG